MLGEHECASARDPREPICHRGGEDPTRHRVLLRKVFGSKAILFMTATWEQTYTLTSRAIPSHGLHKQTDAIPPEVNRSGKSLTLYPDRQQPGSELYEAPWVGCESGCQNNSE